MRVPDGPAGALITANGHILSRTSAIWTMGKYKKEANMMRSAALRDCVRMSCTVSTRNKIPHTTLSMHFRFFNFPEFFGQLKFDDFFVIRKKVGEIQNSKMHWQHTIDHVILNHAISSDLPEVSSS